MAETSWPFDTGAGANVTEAGWAAMAKGFSGDGVMYGDTGTSNLNSLAVSVVSNNNVSVAAGEAMLHGFYYHNDAPLSFTLDTQASGTRYDGIVIRLDRAAKRAYAAVVKNAGLSWAPTRQAQSSGTIWEIALALVPVTNTGAGGLTGPLDYRFPHGANHGELGDVNTQDPTVNAAFINTPAGGGLPATFSFPTNNTKTAIPGVQLSFFLYSPRKVMTTWNLLVFAGAANYLVSGYLYIDNVDGSARMSGVEYGRGTHYFATGTTSGQEMLHGTQRSLLSAGYHTIKLGAYGNIGTVNLDHALYADLNCFDMGPG